jgi:hypothetical protein
LRRCWLLPICRIAKSRAMMACRVHCFMINFFLPNLSLYRIGFSWCCQLCLQIHRLVRSFMAMRWGSDGLNWPSFSFPEVHARTPLFMQGIVF